VLDRLQSFFQLRHEDRRKVWIMGSVFFLAGIAEMLNYTAFMAIFNSRAGTEKLPMMYLIEAFVLPLEGWFLSYVSQRLSKPRFMISIYIFFIVLLFANSAALYLLPMFGADRFWFYVQLFLVSNFVVRQQTMLMWNTAFDLCPTQQAKRLMPVFILAALIGGIVAGIISGTLARFTGPNLIYLLSGVMLLSGLPNFIRSIRQFLLPLTIKADDAVDEAEAQSSSMTYVKGILRSPFLMTVIGIMTMMPAVYFLMEYQYFTSAQAVFRTEEALTSFYGMMVIVLFCMAILLQLFAGRLMDRLGASNTILGISAVFLVSFLLVSVFIGTEYALIAVSAGYCVVYLLLYYFAEPGYHFFFKMLPLSQRDGYRYTAQGIAASAGILIGSSLSMLHSELGVSLPAQAVVGTAAAVVVLILSWLTRSLYIKELVRYLRAGTSTVKNLLEDFIGSMKHDRVRQTLIEQLRHPDAAVRRVAAELYAANPDPLVTGPLLDVCETSQGNIRLLALSAIHPDGWRSADPARRKKLMEDADERVRALAYRKEFEALRLPEERNVLAEKALADASPFVKAEGLRVMEMSERLPEELRALLAAGGDAAILACEVIAERRLGEMQFDVMMRLIDSPPAVKIAAVRAIGRIGGSDAATSLMDLIIAADLELRAAIEQALTDIGRSGMDVWLRFISSPHDDQWQAAVKVLIASGTDQELERHVVPACVRRLELVRLNDAFAEKIEAAGGREWAELARARSKEIEEALLDTIWSLMIRFGDERSVPQLRRALEDGDDETRDHGLEILSEGLGNARLSAALLAHYQNRSGLRSNGEEAAGSATDPWLQAIAVKAGAAEGEAVLLSNWEYLSALDKIVFLKQVPLFSDISVDQLGRVAAIAEEKVYEEGEYLIRQGESGHALFLIVEGHVELSGKNEDGTEGTLGVFGPMQAIGESALFDSGPSRISAQALFDKARVLVIDGEQAVRLVRLYPDIGVGLLRSISHRLQSTEQLLLKLG